jgi:spermidine synthase
MDASYVDLADARHLEFDYLRRMRDLVEAAGARRVVHVGGAGCALARALAAAYPDARQEVIELDAGVVELARRHLGLRRSPGLRVRVGDGRALLAARPEGTADAGVRRRRAGLA